MRREPDFFEEQELELVYIAKKLRTAKALEQLLTERSVDYLVEPDTYMGGIIFRTERVGAFFYILPQDMERTLAAMSEKGYRPNKPASS